MKNKQGFLVPLLIIILVLVAASGYFLYSKSKVNQPKPKSASVSIAELKTYTNARSGFQFKYPANHTDFFLTTNLATHKTGIYVEKLENYSEVKYHNTITAVSSEISRKIGDRGDDLDKGETLVVNVFPLAGYGFSSIPGGIEYDCNFDYSLGKCVWTKKINENSSVAYDPIIVKTADNMTGYKFSDGDAGWRISIFAIPYGDKHTMIEVGVLTGPNSAETISPEQLVKTLKETWSPH